MTSDRILVTGADGFIGSHLVEALVAAGYKTRAFVFYNSLNSWFWLDKLDKNIRDEIEVYTGDLRDRSSVENAILGCDNVLHLGALIAIPYSYRAPQSYVDTNIAGTLNVLESARRLGVKRVVCTSTSEVYGTAQFVPITEKHPLNAQSPYAATKVAADQLALSYHRSFNTPVAILRPFNTYGPRQSARAVIPTVISQISSGSRQIRLGALRPTRDFTYVKDTAQGFIDIMNCDAAVGQVVNIGSGFEISVGDAVLAIASVMGTEVEIISDPERLRPEASEVERLFAGVDLAERLFGWAPNYGGLLGFRRGLAETAAWFCNPENLALYRTDRFND